MLETYTNSNLSFQNCQNWIWRHLICCWQIQNLSCYCQMLSDAYFDCLQCNYFHSQYFHYQILNMYKCIGRWNDRQIQRFEEMLITCSLSSRHIRCLEKNHYGLEFCKRKRVQGHHRTPEVNLMYIYRKKKINSFFASFTNLKMQFFPDTL